MAILEEVAWHLQICKSCFYLVSEPWPGGGVGVGGGGGLLLPLGSMSPYFENRIPLKPVLE